MTRYRVPPPPFRFFDRRYPNTRGGDLLTPLAGDEARLCALGFEAVEEPTPELEGSEAPEAEEALPAAPPTLPEPLKDPPQSAPVPPYVTAARKAVETGKRGGKRVLLVDPSTTSPPVTAAPSAPAPELSETVEPVAATEPVSTASTTESSAPATPTEPQAEMPAEPA